MMTKEMMMAIARDKNENKVAHAMATHSRLVTHKWRHKINVKSLFTDDPTHEAIDELCSAVAEQLRCVIESEASRRDQKDDNERDYFVGQLEEVKESFDCMIGTVEDESVDDRQDSFNYVLAELYDVGDMKIELRGGGLQKFLWVN